MDDVSRARGKQEGRRLAAFIDGPPPLEEVAAVAAPSDEEHVPPPPLSPELEARLLRDMERAHPSRHTILPAAAEGELRDLARDLRARGLDDEAERLKAIVAKFSGVKPFRSKR